jgi:hypothetical protein
MFSRVSTVPNVSGAAATTIVDVGAAGETVACAVIQFRAMKAAMPPITMAINRIKKLPLRIPCPHVRAIVRGQSSPEATFGSISLLGAVLYLR